MSSGCTTGTQERQPWCVLVEGNTVYSICFQAAQCIYDYSFITPQLVLAACLTLDSLMLKFLSPNEQVRCMLQLPRLEWSVYHEIYSLHDTRTTGCHGSTFVPRPAGCSYSLNRDLIVFGVSITSNIFTILPTPPEALFLVLDRASLIKLVSNLSGYCNWEDWSPGIARWLPNLYDGLRCSLFGWRIVMLGDAGDAMERLEAWGFRTMNTERLFNLYEIKHRLLVVDFNPYQFLNGTGEEDGPLSADYDREKTVQFASSGPVYRHRIGWALKDQMPCRIWMTKEPVDVDGVGIAEDTIVGFQVRKRVSWLMLRS